MRTFEMVTGIINVLMLGWFILPVRRSQRALLIGLAVSAIAVVTHGLIEGMRWQMIPIYAITFIPIVVLAVRLLTKPKQEAKKRSRIRLVLAVVLASLYAIIAMALPLLLPVFTFEKPAGPYAIGTVTYNWIDEHREETFTPESGDKRKLAVQIWYPADKDARRTPAPYVSDGGIYAEGLSQFLEMPKLLFTAFGHVKTHAAVNADISNRESAYPVLLFSHGFGMYKSQNNFQIEQLVSQGYIVVGFNHTYSSAATIFDDGQVAYYVAQDKESSDYLDGANEGWVEDAKFVLDQLEEIAAKHSEGRFAGRMDMEKIGMFGHSFGGATSTQLLMTDDRIKAAINMDGILYGKLRIPEEGLQKPFLLMSADRSLSIVQDIADREQAEMIARMLTRYERVPVGGNYWLTIHDSDHAAFSDFYLLSPLIERMAGVHIRQVHRIINDYSLDFFDHYLKQQPSRLLEHNIGEHPEYTLQRG
ncbi:acetylhydrolase [Paenibacillus sp. J5C_2022]|uniref:alpha/beta hydrolase n=1 Tax=Paenibacillus sp. J5C2022 TaxID=2977129 RepID=UPI0021CE1617|nr:acetylhydrolase [Paenibacillus sp. J5C2022]MCU6712136.1 acetylhydrolase [Paenibacillus sp. J5C2022]